MPTFTVVPFPLNTTASCRLTQQDKIDTWFWEQKTALDRGYNPTVVQAHEWAQNLDQDEFVLIYPLGHSGARWGAARQGSKIMVWRCSDGAEAGLYSCMNLALDGIPHASSAYAAITGHSAECRVAQMRSTSMRDVTAWPESRP